MSESQKFLHGKQVINNYLPAVLKENKSGWIIEYYVVHPQTLKMERKQIKCNRICSRYKKMTDARKHIAGMINALNIKLAGGWNPFFEGEDARMFVLLEKVCELFLNEKAKETRENTMRSYRSFCKMLTEWSNKCFPDMYASVFNHNIAVRYMDHIYGKSNTGVTTYNNHIKMGRALFNWAKEKCYTKQNPFDSIKTKAKPIKTRTIIPQEIRRKISSDLEEHSPTFLIICKLLYNSLIRPGEIKLLKIENVFLERRYIYVPGDVAKNHHPRFATITKDIITALQQLHLERYPKSYYLFGSNLYPAKERAGNGRYGEEWDKLRKRLKLPAEMQLYSLRDTGIFDMLKSGIDDLSVMQHADHSSLDITTIYANHHDPNLINRIYEQAPKF